MAKQKQEDPPKGSPAWMSTFSDLMNLLLCFFVLLFSMSSTDTEKFEEVIASIQSSFSIFSSGGSSIGEGQMISSGISQLEMFDDYFKSVTDGEDQEYEKEGGSDTESELDISTAEAEEVLEKAGAEDSEAIADQVEEQLAAYGLQDQVEVDFNANYVLITINGALLFNSGEATLSEDADNIIDKLAQILENYQDNIIEVEGHTDNVPMRSNKYENNDVLSMYRALYVADYIREHSTINPAHIKSAGRGEYVPIADNSTAEGRARNRRVEIKIYNSYSSDLEGDTEPLEEPETDETTVDTESVDDASDPAETSDVSDTQAETAEQPANTTE